jgi:hypothetical protein
MVSTGLLAARGIEPFSPIRLVPPDAPVPALLPPANAGRTITTLKKKIISFFISFSLIKIYVITVTVINTTRGLLLQGTYHHSPDKVFLDERVEEHHGQGPYYQYRVPELGHQIQPGGYFRRIHLNKEFLGRGSDKQEIPKYLLKTVSFRPCQIQHGAEITIPNSYGIKENHDGNYRRGQGQGEAKKELQITAAVYMGRVQKAGGQGTLEPGFNNDHIVTGEPGSYNERPAAAYQVKIPHEKIRRYKAAGKEHGDHKKGLKKTAIRQIPPGQGIGRQQNKGHRDYGPAGYIEKGIEETAPEQGVPEYTSIGVQMEIYRPEKNFPAEYRIGTAKRTDHHIEKGIENQNPRQDKPEGTNQMKNLVRRRKPHRHYGVFFQTLLFSHVPS